MASVTFETPAQEEFYGHIQTGFSKARSGDLDNSIIELRKADEIYPAFVAGCNLGLVYRDKKDYNTSAEHLEKVYKETPRDLDLNFNYSLVLFEPGKYEEALPKKDEYIRELVEKARQGVKAKLKNEI